MCLCRGLVQYTAVRTEWKASSGTIPTKHKFSLWPQYTVVPPYLLIQYPRFTVTPKKICKLKK
jgi:hypothetical protein